MEPHRGTTVLVLGILSFVVCPICGIVAWVMANKDIPKMEAGTMDPEGIGQTKAGKICGIVSLILAAIVIVIYLLVFVVAVGAGVTQGAF